MFGIGLPEMLVVLVIIFIVFGAGKLPEIGGAIGRSIKSFKKATHDPDEIATAPSADKKLAEPKA
ncbi:MAG: twin-arginine translocase TatA/TatE family subunit [Syntrophales bacterium]